jgi:putative peptide modification system cyclase
MSHADKDAAMNDAHRPHAEGPQLRTLLLTDLCDSTTLVERLGDGPAADLFREHDRLVLVLQQRWRGRLIDRSDGLLLLFERPIDGLGFALDYARGLREMGTARKLDLKARAGLHVGEVLTWRNSDEAVKVGAKPVEVEGLAKPMAGRLMATARPGQILLSAVAEPLAHRAARELGERGQQLLWKSHGRWRFKGVPEPQEIYEVGEPGIAPLRAPPNGPKAWRDVPLWRRPAALAAEIAVLAVIGTGVWFATRPQPAIAFNQRDWVVVGDLRNLTGQGVLDDSLEQAFRISLEQSRYVNVLSDLKARDTLDRMQRKPDTVLDRAVASEIALRDGARAVILPTVAEVGGRVRVSAEVIDPHTQTTVYAESADGSGAQSTLGSIDTVTAALREKLGEAMKSIERDSEPLPKVATKNLDALRAYALGQKAFGAARYEDAANFYQRATTLDPNFALAYLGGVRTAVARVDATHAKPFLVQAIEHRDRLPPRDALYLDAWSAEFGGGHQAVGKWKLLADLYPDYFAGAANYAFALMQESRFGEAKAYAQRTTVPQNPLRGHGFDNVGRSELAQEHYGAARTAFDQALKLDVSDAARRRANVSAAQGGLDDASRRLDGVGSLRKGYAGVRDLDKTALLLDQGRWREAERYIDAAAQLPVEGNALLKDVLGVTKASVVMLNGDRARAHELLAAAAKRALTASGEGAGYDEVDYVYLALACAYLAQRQDDTGVASSVLDALKDRPRLWDTPKLAELREIVLAGQERLNGKPEAAIKRLIPLVNGHELFQTHTALLDAYQAAGNFEQALTQARWLAAHRGLAYIELAGAQSLQATNVADTRLARLRTAEALQALGRSDEAHKEARAFSNAWASDAPPAYLSRLGPIMPASKQ